MATFIDINLDYATSQSLPVRAESDIGTNPGYKAGRQVTGEGQSGYHTPSTKAQKVLKLLGKDCGCSHGQRT